MSAQIQMSTVQEWNSRLSDIYTTHDLSYTYVVFDSTHPLSENIKELYEKFQSAYSEQHLAQAVKWTIEAGELNVGSLMKEQMVTSVNVSLTSMEAQVHYSKVTNTAVTTYSRSTNKAQTTFNEAYHKIATTYRRTVNSSAGSTYTRTVQTNGWTYTHTNNRAGTNYSITSHRAGVSYTES